MLTKAGTARCRASGTSFSRSNGWSIMPELNFLYVPTMRTGYGRAGTSICREMRKMGITVYDHLEGSEEGIGEHSLNQGSQSGIGNTIAWFSTPAHAQWWYKGQRTVMYTMWESFDLPEDFRKT